MKPSAKKPGSGKKVRVAATFTGAAAAAFAFAPAAAAGTGQPAITGPGHQAGQPTAVGPGYQAAQPAVGPGHRANIRPDGLEYACPGGTEHWLHLARDQGGDMCVGSRGLYHVSFPQSISRFCGGNNIGWFSGTSVVHGRPETVYFGHGNYYAWVKPEPMLVRNVYIDKWGGNDKCGSP
jgi:hypothetical protein